MKWTSILAIYALLWVMSAFLMLPFGIKTHDEAGIAKVPGQADSAPANFRPGRVAARATHPFASLVAFGLVSIWFVHVLVNVGMTMNLMPIAGIPLPFFSYGGSFMLACWIAVGIEGRLSVEGRGKADMLAI